MAAAEELKLRRFFYCDVCITHPMVIRNSSKQTRYAGFARTWRKFYCAFRVHHVEDESFFTVTCDDFSGESGNLNSKRWRRWWKDGCKNAGKVKVAWPKSGRLGPMSVKFSTVTFDLVVYIDNYSWIVNKIVANWQLNKTLLSTNYRWKCWTERKRYLEKKWTGLVLRPIYRRRTRKTTLLANSVMMK